MKPFFCLLRVLLNKPNEGSGSNKLSKSDAPIAGYYRNIGVVAEDKERAMAVLASIIDEGRIDWEQSRFLEFEELDQDIVKRYNESKDRNPWYLSGRGYFPAEK